MDLSPRQKSRCLEKHKRQVCEGRTVQKQNKFTENAHPRLIESATTHGIQTEENTVNGKNKKGDKKKTKP